MQLACYLLQIRVLEVKKDGCQILPEKQLPSGPVIGRRFGEPSWWSVPTTSLQAHGRQDSYWTLSPSVSGNWSNAGNWSLGVPDSTSQAFTSTAGRQRSHRRQPAATLSWATALGSGTLEMTAGSLFGPWKPASYFGTGTLAQSGGTNNSPTLEVGTWASGNSVGTYDLGGSGKCS